MVNAPFESSISRSGLSGENLRLQIETILGERAGQKQIDDFIHFCHRLAVAYLKVKTASRRFDSRGFGLNIEDFAFDAIGEIFRRDETDNFVEWRTYFSKLDPIPGLSDDELFVAVRRIVLSCVNHRIFRVFGEFEPSQARISRNTKLALKRHPRLVLRDERGNWVVSLRSASRDASPLPEIAPETLDAWFTGRVTPASPIRAIMDCVTDLLADRPEYRGSISFLSLVRSISSVFSRGYAHENTTSEDPGLAPFEIQRIVDTVVEKTRQRGVSSYVNRKKLSHAEIEAHVLAVHAILLRECGMDGVGDEPYFVLLKKQLPTLTRAGYAKRHRTILEYLARVAKAEVANVVRGEFDSARGSECNKFHVGDKKSTERHR